MNISKSLRIAMIHKSVKQSDVAKGLGVGVPQISKWANNQVITSKRMHDLARYFEMPVSEFIKLGE